MFNEDLYIKLRTKEGRMYHDSSLVDLPYIDKSNPTYDEWKIRAASFERLKNYLSQKNKSLNILDLGCGNGWMTNRLSEINNAIVTGVDMNLVELKQAIRVFAANKNLKFIYGNIFENIVEPKSFDIIIMAASVQYFNDLNKLFNRLLGLLKVEGEIHIIDSNFYSDEEKIAAQKRTLAYYKKLGFEEFAVNYHHHTWNELKDFNYKILNRSFADNLNRKFLKDKALMFPWVLIKHEKSQTK